MKAQIVLTIAETPDGPSIRVQVLGQNLAPREIVLLLLNAASNIIMGPPQPEPEAGIQVPPPDVSKQLLLPR